MQDKLEIISASGQIEFYVLDPGKGISNIGRHPENDIVLDGPGIAPFHAMLDHRQKPYQIMLLAREGQTLLGEEPLPVNVSRALRNWDNIKFNGYTLVLVEEDGQPAAGVAGVMPVPLPAPGGPVAVQPSMPPPPAPLPLRPAGTVPPTSRPEIPGEVYGTTTPLPQQVPATALAGPLADETDHIIVVEIGEREWTIDVDQTASYQLTIINGGDIVATFQVSVVGLNPEWIIVSPAQVNLYEGDRATVTVTVTPPRLPSSRDGTHDFGIQVTSPNHPGRLSQLAAALTINPYYEFGVGELSPRQQTISWFKRSGETMMSIFNQGNSATTFRLDAEDTERACVFEFQMPGEPTTRARQADMRLPPDSTVSIPITISPHSRRLVGFRKRTYSYTVTANLGEEQQVPRSLLGELRSKPLIGPILILLIFLLLLALIVIIFNPRIRLFNIDGSKTKVITSGETVLLRWNASSLANLSINPDLGEVGGPLGTATVVPTADVVYELRAVNWLTRLSPRWFTAMEEVRVFVTPVPPTIRFFEVDKESIILGEQDVNLSWHVEEAEELTLEINGLPQTLAEHAGTLTDMPDEETTYVLIASNPYKEESRSRIVKVVPPTVTPVPTPVVKKFIVNPPVIVEGESVSIEWEIEGAEDVSIQPIGANLPPSQSVVQSPPETTNYILNAAIGPAKIDPLARTVFVTPAPTATPEPEAPEIVFFTADPAELVQGKADSEEDEKDVTVSWSVKGTVTNVELNGGPDIGIFSNLEPESSLTVTVDKNTVFVLTAFNEDKTASSTTQVAVVEATPTPVPTDTPIPPDTPTPLPPEPVIALFSASPIKQTDVDKVQLISGSETSENKTYQIQVGTDTQLQWNIENDPDTVILTGPGVSAPVAATGSFLLGEVLIPGIYNLTAKTAGGTAQSTLEVVVVPQDPPSPPQNFTGQNIGGPNGTNTFNWNYPALERESILGFRIYRDGSLQADVDVLTNEPPYTWSDTAGNDYCGSIYYIVGVYDDFLLGPRETDSADRSWIPPSPPCPP